MEYFVVTGGKKLIGKTTISGAKNVALKALVAACLTDEQVTIDNIPLIADFFVMVDIMKDLGAKVSIRDHTVKVQMKKFKTHEIPLEKGAQLRTSSIFIAPLLARNGEAIIPNPGGCRLGARPIDRIVEGMKKLHADIVYHSEDGYFHAKTKGLEGATYTFPKNSHTGTETLILGGVLAKGITVLKNAAEEPEIDELIALLNQMGGRITRSAKREITIEGVAKLSGTRFRIEPDRNELVTFAIAAVATKGDIVVEGVTGKGIEAFLEKLHEAGGGYVQEGNNLRFYYKGPIKAVNITTSMYPGFMTDWQAPWAILMTQAKGVSMIHETVFENKMGYIQDLSKMGAHITPFVPHVANPDTLYNFNLEDDKEEYIHAITIKGPSTLHNAVCSMIDLRAGAAIVLAALIAHGTSTIFGIDKLDRGYEQFEKRLTRLGAKIQRKDED